VSRRRHPVVVVVNQSKVLLDTDVARALAAVQRQVTYHFGPVWNVGATLWPWSKDTPIPDEAWAIIVADTSDEAGALGYHEVGTHSGQPIGFVFAADDMKYGYSWTVTLSHELLEMLGDPRANLAAQIDNDTWVAYEAADPVEADNLGYDVDGILVSDFPTPEWFDPTADGPFDYRGHCTAPLQILPGGYIGKWTAKTGWTQEANGEPRHRDGHRFRLRAGTDPRERGAVHRVGRGITKPDYSLPPAELL
jgi:hypothetical protein